MLYHIKSFSEDLVLIHATSRRCTGFSSQGHKSRVHRQACSNIPPIFEAPIILPITVATMVYTMITRHYKLQSSRGSTRIKLSSTISSPFSTRHNKLQNSLGFTHIKLSSTNVNLQWWALLFWWTLVNSV